MLLRNLLITAVLALFVYEIAPLVLPLAMGALFAVLFFPVQRWLEERGKLPTGLAATTVTLGVTALILLPGAVLLTLGVQAGVRLFRGWRASANSAPTGETGLLEAIVAQPGVQRLLGLLERWFHLTQAEVMQTLQEIGQTVALRFGELVTNFIGRLPAFGLGLAILIVSLFFFLLDGRRLVAFLRQASVFTIDETEALIRSTAAMCRSVVLASVLSGAGQSLLFGIAAVVCRVPSAPLIALVVFLGSFIPLIGAAPITFGVALHQGLTRGPAWGLALGLVAVATSLVDNFVRPAVLREGGDLHPLLAFVAAFGGLQVFGFAGVFLGPVIAGMAVVLTRQWLARRQAAA